jgi:hypothetical protein
VVLSARDLPVAELSSLRLDGEVFPMGDFWCPVDQADTPGQRAAALGLLVPRRAIAERLSAAWIWGLAGEPEQHQVCVDTAARTHFPWSSRYHFRELNCPPRDTVRIAGMLVTRPRRTALDLARWTPAALPDPAPLLATLLVLAGDADTSEARRECERAHLPHTKAALAHFARAQLFFDEGRPYPSLTRYTS